VRPTREAKNKVPDRLENLLNQLLAVWEPHLRQLLEFLPLAVLAVIGRLLTSWHDRRHNTLLGAVLESCVAAFSALIVDALLQALVHPLPMGLRIAAAGMSGVLGRRALDLLAERMCETLKGKNE